MVRSEFLKRLINASLAGPPAAMSRSKGALQCIPRTLIALFPFLTGSFGNASYVASVARMGQGSGQLAYSSLTGSHCPAFCVLGIFWLVEPIMRFSIDRTIWLSN